MPGNVPAISPTGLSVMPRSLCTSFTQSREFAVAVNEYPDGSSQRRVQISNGGDAADLLPRLHWKLSKRLTPAAMVALRNFFDARRGQAFIFYDPNECVGFNNYDESGASEDGRFLCHFIGEWRQNQGIARGDVSVEFVELAQAKGSGQFDFSDEDNSGLLGML